MTIEYHKSFSLVAGTMLLLAVPSMWPYGYYQLLKWVVSGVATYNAYSAYHSQKQNWMFLMIGVAVLFNPIAPFFLAKQTWVILDFAAAVIMFSYSRIQHK